MVWGGVGVHRTSGRHTRHTAATCIVAQRVVLYPTPSGPPPSYSGQKRVALLPQRHPLWHSSPQGYPL